eukprot:1999996-Rhodomonas_salina.2
MVGVTTRAAASARKDLRGLLAPIVCRGDLESSVMCFARTKKRAEELAGVRRLAYVSAFRTSDAILLQARSNLPLEEIMMRT